MLKENYHSCVLGLAIYLASELFHYTMGIEQLYYLHMFKRTRQILVLKKVVFIALFSHGKKWLRYISINLLMKSFFVRESLNS